MWWYDIPTLMQYSPLITPPYYLLLTEFLSRPADRQIRSVLVLTHPNERMLSIVGCPFCHCGLRSRIRRAQGEVPVPGQDRCSAGRARAVPIWATTRRPRYASVAASARAFVSCTRRLRWAAHGCDRRSAGRAVCPSRGRSAHLPQKRLFSERVQCGPLDLGSTGAI